MADFGFNSGVAAYQTVVDEPARQQNIQSESSLLSSRAAQQKLITQEAQQASRTRLASMAAQSKAQLDNLQIDSTTLEGQDKIYDMAIKSMVVHPDVQESLRAKKTANLQEMANNSTRQSKMRGEQAEEKANVVNEALLDPEKGAADILAIAEKTGDKQLQGLGLALSGAVPVPKKYTDGETLSYSQLSPTQKDTLHNAIRTTFPGGQREKTLHDVQMEMMAGAKAVEKSREEDEKKQYHSQQIALKQAGLEQSAELKKSKLALDVKAGELKTQELELKKQQQVTTLEKRLSEIPETIKNPKYKQYNPFDNEPATLPNPAVDRIQKQIDKLQGVEAKPTTLAKPTLTQEDKTAIEWANSHPTDPQAKEILKRHGL